MDLDERNEKIAAALNSVTDPEQQDFEERCRPARADAIQYISYGGRSSGKVRQQLIKKGYPAQVVSEVMRYLQEEGYLKDADLIAAAWAQRRGAKAESVHYFAIRMKRMGIAPEVIDAFVAAHDVNKTDALSLASYLRAVHIDNLRKLKSLSERAERDPKTLNRLVRQAQSRGFSLDLIFTSLDRMGISHF